jgi:hypothetical protein
MEITISSVDEEIIFDNEIIKYLNIYAGYHDILTLGTNLGTKRYYTNRDEFKDHNLCACADPHLLTAVPAPGGSLSPNCSDPKDSLVVYECSQFEQTIRYVTPEAAEVRRQIKELECDLLAIRCDRGWYGVGGKHDIPHDACYVGHHGDCYVWVCPDGLEALSKLTIKTLKFAGLIKDQSILTVPGPRFTPASGFPSL